MRRPGPRRVPRTSRRSSARARQASGHRAHPGRPSAPRRRSLAVETSTRGLGARPAAPAPARSAGSPASSARRASTRLLDVGERVAGSRSACAGVSASVMAVRGIPAVPLPGSPDDTSPARTCVSPALGHSVRRVRWRWRSRRRSTCGRGRRRRRGWGAAGFGGCCEFVGIIRTNSAHRPASRRGTRTSPNAGSLATPRRSLRPPLDSARVLGRGGNQARRRRGARGSCHGAVGDRVGTSRGPSGTHVMVRRRRGPARRVAAVVAPPHALERNDSTSGSRSSVSGSATSTSTRTPATTTQPRVRSRPRSRAGGGVDQVSSVTLTGGPTSTRVT